MNDWIRRNLSHELEWCDGRTKIVISHSRWSCDIYVYPGGSKSGPIKLLTTYARDRIHICDLPDAGPNKIWHGQKYGTLLVSLLAQAYKLIFPKQNHVEIEVWGETHCDLKGSNEEVLDDCRRRSGFWERFGLVVKNPDARKSRMSCLLSEFSPVAREIYPGLSTDLLLHKFSLQIHLPEIATVDLDRLGAIELVKLDINRVEKLEQEIKKGRELKYKQLRLVSLLLSLVFSVSIALVIPSQFSKSIQVALSIPVAFLVNPLLLHFLPISWLERMPSAYFERGKLGERREVLDGIHETLTPHLLSEQGFVGRIYNALKSKNKSVSGEKFDYLAYCAENNSIDEKDYLDIAKMIIEMKGVLSSMKADPERPEISDFLFGENSSMSISELNLYCGRLGERFSFQINRLLGKLENNYLPIYGSPSDSVSEVLKSLKEQIALIEFYPGNQDYDIHQVGAKIFINQGVIDFGSVWCTWKESYLEQILREFRMLFELTQEDGSSLISRSYIKWKKRGELQLVSQDFKAFSAEIADLSGARYSDSSINQVVQSILGRSVEKLA